MSLYTGKHGRTLSADGGTRRDFVRMAVAGTAAMTAAPLAGFAAEQRKSEKVSPRVVEEAVAEWPKKAREVAEKTMKKYGPPDEATPSHLLWFENGPWKYTIVYREEVPHKFPMPHVDVLEQVIDYRVPPEKFDELARYDGSVTVRRTKGEMSAMCDKEEANFLALNLAHEIIADRRDVEDARQFYAQAVIDLMNGKKPPSTQELQFRVAAKDGTRDPDVAIIENGEIIQKQQN